LTTDAGLWITSPAAIWLTTASGKRKIWSAMQIENVSQR